MAGRVDAVAQAIRAGEYRVLPLLCADTRVERKDIACIVSDAAGAPYVCPFLYGLEVRVGSTRHRRVNYSSVRSLLDGRNTAQQRVYVLCLCQRRDETFAGPG